MRFYQLIKTLHSFRAERALKDFRVKGLSSDSRSVRPGFVFVAVKGEAADGREFIADAVARGAQAVIASPGGRSYSPGPKVNFLEVADARRTLSFLAAEFFGNPSARMQVAGVTGTNGKTTVTYLIEAILKKAKASPGVIGTVNYRFGGKVRPAVNTTPGPVELQHLLAGMFRAGVSHVLMEVSSHALDQGRTGGVRFSSAVFTNLTQDHLDYHRSLERYFSAKAKLFTGLSPQASAIINADDGWGRKLARLTPARVLTYGIRSGAVRADKLAMSAFGSSFTLYRGKMRARIVTGLIGAHNVYNLLAAAAWALDQGIDLRTVQQAVGGFAGVPGRLQRVRGAGKFSVFVDYAHTEDGLKNVLAALRQVSRGRIIVVFGCGGDRDREKRPKMGRTAVDLADYVLVTSDNPRSEDPRRIAEEITGGMRGGNYRVVLDRREAIREALQSAGKGDVVLIAGKGHENYQIFADGRVPFDDRKVVEECLRSMKY